MAFLCLIAVVSLVTGLCALFFGRESKLAGVILILAALLLFFLLSIHFFHWLEVELLTPLQGLVG